jgi:hypothetical protein
MKTAIVSIHANRPSYSKQVLDAIDHQSLDLFHIVSLEDSCPEKFEINAILESKKWSYAGMDIIYNKQIAHTNNNLLNALRHLVSSDHGFDSYIYMEDDTMFSKGAVNFMLHHLNKHKDEPRFSHVAIGSVEDSLPVTPFNLFKWQHEYDWCSLWGYAAPISMAHKLIALTKPVYTPDERETIRNDHSLVWDNSYANYFRSAGMYCVTPVISRLNNIGVDGGLHSCGRTWASWEGL